MCAKRLSHAATPSQLRSAINRIAAERLRAARPGVPMWDSYPEHVKHAEDVLVEGLDFAILRSDFAAGDGNELEPRTSKGGARGDVPPKFHAVLSSSALAANAFGAFRSDPSALSIAGISGFASLRFERKMPTGVRRAEANLDVALESSEVLVGVESKFSELLAGKEAKFADGYEAAVAEAKSDPWRKFHGRLVRNPERFSHLDAAQLVKHFLGLAGAASGRRAVLVYLFWEPTNATRFDVYRRHAEEVERAVDELGDASIPLVAMRYSELWDALGSAAPEHAARLQARYAFALA
ncbi:MAG: hypothetical protein KC560_18245 [Myxococcales bacterium]|nr:hypothetical protein [Myxococcales bacterium]